MSYHDGPVNVTRHDGPPGGWVETGEEEVKERGLESGAWKIGQLELDTSFPP